ncbi:MAG: hypothetical protein JJU45_00220 [Acidimicrobiia bacterium]|nr:hypothetical protein [Acidimicrobiia bacterium]
MATDLETLADRLEQLEEDLAEAAIDRLRAAVANGKSDEDAAAIAAAEERTITKARRAVAKAAHLLRGMDAG